MENMQLAYQLGWQSRAHDLNPMPLRTLEYHMWNLGRLERGFHPVESPLAAYPDPETLKPYLEMKP